MGNQNNNQSTAKKLVNILKQSQNQPYNNCNLKTINVENQKTINTINKINELEAQLKAATKQERKIYLRVQRNFGAMATATTYEAYNAAVSKINKRYSLDANLWYGEMSADARRNLLNKFWEKEGIRKNFFEQGQDNLTRMIAGYKYHLLTFGC